LTFETKEVVGSLSQQVLGMSFVVPQVLGMSFVVPRSYCRTTVDVLSLVIILRCPTEVR
jgi:hypothetical protein